MSTGTAELQNAIVATWASAGLNAVFQALWADDVVASDHLVLEDTDAEPEHPFPYCVYETQAPRAISSMSFDETTFRTVRETIVQFTVHADAVDGDDRSPKQIASYLAEEVMKVFGGHPTQSPTVMTMSTASHLQTTYLADYPQPEQRYRYAWVIRYAMLVDAPVAL